MSRLSCEDESGICNSGFPRAVDRAATNNEGEISELRTPPKSARELFIWTGGGCRRPCPQLPQSWHFAVNKVKLNKGILKKTAKYMKKSE